MPDLKTVTFDAELMRRAFNIAMNTDWHEESPTTFVMRSVWETAWRAAMLTAAPTPAAQSAGQEAVFTLRKRGDDFDVTNITPGYSALPEGEYALYAAPVNGGERDSSYQPYSAFDFTNLVAENASLKLDVQRLEKQVLELNEALHVADLASAADAPQVGALKDHEFRELVSSLTVIGQVYGNTQQLRERIGSALSAALTSPAKTGEAETLQALGEAALAAKGMQATVKEVFAKVGGDEREAFEAWYEAAAMPAEADWFKREADDPNEYAHGHTQSAWEGWQARAALSADGGEAAAQPDMFWNNDDPEQVQDSIHNVVVEAFESGYAIGDAVEIQQAIRLENVKVRVTQDEAGYVSYEYIDAAIAGNAKGE